MKRPIAYVAGTGRGIPAKVMTNHDFAALGLETSHEWIVERTGIVERRIAAADETTCSMAVKASCQAMAKAGVHAGELDAIIISTATPDRLLPSTAVDLQAKLGASRAAAFDLSAACTGWIYAMTVAEGMIQSGVIETALVVGAEKMSSIVDWKDRSTCVLFGDGAGAVVLVSSEKPGVHASVLRADGSHVETVSLSSYTGLIAKTVTTTNDTHRSVTVDRYTDGDMVIVLWDGAAMARDGKSYENTHSWYLQMKNGKIVSATAFYDAIAFNDLWKRVRPGRL